MNWDAIGSIAEIIGALGVILTLFYLTTQIRQNTHALESASYDTAMHEANSLRQAIGASEEISRIWISGLSDPYSLSELERERFRLYLSALVDIMNTSYMKRGRSIMTTESWETTEGTIDRIIGTPGMQWYLENYSAMVTSTFLEYLRGKQEGLRV